MTPPKVFVSKFPTNIKFECLVNSFPISNIYWTRNKNNNKMNVSSTNKYRGVTLRNRKSLKNAINQNNQQQKQTAKKNQNKNTKNKSNRKLGNRNLDDEKSLTESVHILNSNPRYEINDIFLNETFKSSTIMINVESQDDFGSYECFSNSTAGFKSVKFFIYGGMFLQIFFLLCLFYLNN